MIQISAAPLQEQLAGMLKVGVDVDQEVRVKTRLSRRVTVQTRPASVIVKLATMVVNFGV